MVERSFYRHVRIPEGILPDSITASVDGRGLLCIEGKKVVEQPFKRTIHIDYLD